MTETNGQADKKPGIVIFVAVLNFISTALFLLLSVLSLLVIIFGNIMGVQDFVTRQISQYSQNPNFSYGLVFIFAVMLAASLFFMVFFLMIGIGLLRGKKMAWYFQIAMSILGLAGFPIGTAINLAILVLFFQSAVRSYFKV